MTEMTIQTLLVTTDQTDYSLPERLNLQTDSLIGNQCNRDSIETWSYFGHRVEYINATDRGVGKNRNRLLERADADLLILADDDMRFVDNYPQIALEAVRLCGCADVYVFNLIEKNPQRYVNHRVKRIGRTNYARYGAARLMLRRESIEKAGIQFSLEFGGGAKYGSGEDTIFLHECIDRGLKVFAVPLALAEIDQEATSTWFSGYHKHFFEDKGALYACLYPKCWSIMAFRFLLVHYKSFHTDLPFTFAYLAMLTGGTSYRAEKRDSHEI